MPILQKTQSLCPQCLRLLDAQYVSEGSNKDVYMEKTCPVHGFFRVPIWTHKENVPQFTTWNVPTPPHYVRNTATEIQKGCPYDCGLCPDHAQQTCCALIEVTQRCNLQCPLCYATARNDSTDPSIEQIDSMLDTLWHYAGPANVQLSGGEPTVRNDLVDIVRLVRTAKKMSNSDNVRCFPFVQLNTNGVRLGLEEAYAVELQEAGVNVVYLQWDSHDAGHLAQLRGTYPRLLEIKERALAHCLKAGLAVVLVMTLVRSVNEQDVGAVLQQAIHSDALVRGLHIQPVASFGRTPWEQATAPRLTIPDVLHCLEEQSQGLVRVTDFHSPSSEHTLCSFSAVYTRTEDKTLRLVPHERTQCCVPQEQAIQARDFVAGHWNSCACTTDNDSILSEHTKNAGHTDTLDAFLVGRHIRQRFTLSCMAFQDAYTVDIARLRRCHIHIVTADNRLIPFCAHNITSVAGTSLYKRGVHVL